METVPGRQEHAGIRTHVLQIYLRGINTYERNRVARRCVTSCDVVRRRATGDIYIGMLLIW
jgi:hypothetical protein